MSWQSQATEKIRTFAQLPAGWDSYGACPIDPACMDRAVRFIAGLSDGTPRGWVGPTSSGGVSFEWDLPAQRWLIVEFDPDGDGATGGVGIEAGDPECEVEPTAAAVSAWLAG